MIAFNFLFENDPSGGEDPIRISVIAQSLEDAWQRVASKLDMPIETVKSFSPTIQVKELISGQIVVSKRSGALANLDDQSWPQIILDVSRDVTSTIRDSVDAARKDRTELEDKRLGIDIFIIRVFSVAFLAALLFSFYLMLTGNTQPLFNFLFPIITAVLGLISVYIGGKVSSGNARR